ncbi:MAG: hypothetical protein JRM99_07110 [Nitrososphaerota archaeon]|nr:hypothetical protein [Nitrososphaerota archaeon]
MSTLTRGIQGLIIFCALFGVAFLYEVYPVLPQFVFYAVAFGWVLFVVDSVLTFVRPAASYYLGLVLALLAFLATVSQPQHYALIESGDITATLTIAVGSAAEVLLMVLVIAYILSGRRKGQWALTASPQG